MVFSIGIKFSCCILFSRTKVQIALGIQCSGNTGRTGTAPPHCWSTGFWEEYSKHGGRWVRRWGFYLQLCYQFDPMSSVHLHYLQLCCHIYKTRGMCSPNFRAGREVKFQAVTEFQKSHIYSLVESEPEFLISRSRFSHYICLRSEISYNFLKVHFIMVRTLNMRFTLLGKF